MKTKVVVKRILYGIFLYLILLILFGCSANDYLPSPTPTDEFLSEHDAIEKAKLGCTAAGLQPKEDPNNIRAAIMTLGEAQNASESGSFWPYSQSPQHMIWIVTMDGTWLFVGGPEYEDKKSETLETVNHCTIILDAKTGSPIHTTFTRRDDF